MCCSIKADCFLMQASTVRWTSTSVTAIPAGMVAHVKMLLTPIHVTARCQNQDRSHGEAKTVTHAWLAASRTSVSTMQSVSPS